MTNDFCDSASLLSPDSPSTCFNYLTAAKLSPARIYVSVYVLPPDIYCSLLPVLTNSLPMMDELAKRSIWFIQRCLTQCNLTSLRTIATSVACHWRTFRAANDRCKWRSVLRLSRRTTVSSRHWRRSAVRRVIKKIMHRDQVQNVAQVAYAQTSIKLKIQSTADKCICSNVSTQRVRRSAVHCKRFTLTRCG